MSGRVELYALLWAVCDPDHADQSCCNCTRHEEGGCDSPGIVKGMCLRSMGRIAKSSGRVCATADHQMEPGWAIGLNRRVRRRTSICETQRGATTCTPATHPRVNARPGAGISASLEDVFGWSCPFSAELLPAAVFRCLEESGVLESGGGLFRSEVRFSTLGDRLFRHSAFPTGDGDAVFFGPDTYRLAALIERTRENPEVRNRTDRRSPIPQAAAVSSDQAVQPAKQLKEFRCPCPP